MQAAAQVGLIVPVRLAAVVLGQLAKAEAGAPGERAGAGRVHQEAVAIPAMSTEVRLEHSLAEPDQAKAARDNRPVPTAQLGQIHEAPCRRAKWRRRIQRS